MSSQRIWGRIRQALGWATNDPVAEHEGRVQAERAALHEELDPVETADLPARPEDRRPG